MKEISTEEVRIIQLEIVKEIHDFCIENDIRYSLCGGSLIGAIRHQGFIPWDDDIDLMMPRPDYNRFIAQFKSYKSNLSIFNAYSNCEFSSPFSKVVDNRTIVYEDGLEEGVFVDVFPIDGLPDRNARVHVKKLSVYWKLISCFSCRSNIWYRHIVRVIFNRLWLLRKRDALYESVDFDSSQYAGFLCSQYGCRDIMDTNVFKSVILLPFEQLKLYGFEHYDWYLTNLYGDYMQLPPEEKRVNPHKLIAFFK